VPGVAIVETLSGGSREGEQGDALQLAEAFGYAGVGGSDAHIVSHIGRCATEFEQRIANEDELVSALRAHSFRAVSWI
jgi:histidinol phosphatase-like PHP family hydrolase